MQLLTLYLTTAVLFLGLDSLGLRFLIAPVFREHLGDWLLDSPKLAPAGAFYLFYCVGIVYFCSYPQLEGGSLLKAFLTGAFLGALAYGTYEFTNMATLAK